jgi:hypothetical protein
MKTIWKECRGLALVSIPMKMNSAKVEKGEVVPANTKHLMAQLTGNLENTQPYMLHN